MTASVTTASAPRYAGAPRAASYTNRSDTALDRREDLNVLSNQRYRDDVRAEQRMWLQRGIQCVPAIIFERKHLVSGAQGVEKYVSILKQLTENQAA